MTLSFAGTAEGTKLVVEQEGFATEARYALHRDGWTEALERLEHALPLRALTEPQPNARDTTSRGTPFAA